LQQTTHLLTSLSLSILMAHFSRWIWVRWLYWS